MRLWWLLGPCLLALSTAARADIFAYTDASGTVHFSNVPVDTRFQRILKAPVEPAGEPGELPRGNSRWLARSGAYDAMIESAARESTVHAALIRAVIVVESGFNPKARSRRGAAGLMQLLPETARRYGVSNVYDPAQNIRAGARYLSDLISRFDSNLDLALAAYNAGENAVDRYGGRIPPYKETQAYVPQVLKVYRALKTAGPGTVSG